MDCLTNLLAKSVHEKNCFKTMQHGHVVSDIEKLKRQIDLSFTENKKANKKEK